MTFQNTDIVSKKTVYTPMGTCAKSSWHHGMERVIPNCAIPTTKTLNKWWVMVKFAKLYDGNINEHFNDIYQNNASYTVCSRKIENA